MGYDSGLWLKIPSAGGAPGLFLEWVRNYFGPRGLSSLAVRTPANGDDVLVIRMPHLTRADFEHACMYINLKLPE